MDFIAINIFSKGINSMALANIDTLLAEIARIKEQIRWREASLANVNPNYKDNQAYIQRLQGEIASLKADLATQETALASASTPTKVKPTRANTETAVIATPYDDDGNLNAGWRINEETGEPYYVGTDVPISQPEIDPAESARLEAEQRLLAQEQPDYNKPPEVDPNEDPVAALDEATRLEREQELFRQQLAEQEDPFDAGSLNRQGIPSATNNARAQASTQDAVNFSQLPDWRVRLALAPNTPNILYKADPAGILQPLQATNGVVFPYTPSVQVNYSANYEPFDLVHNNYKVYQYKNSSVEQLQITCDFTAQDTKEATYLLAVIHFFRSVTKMFYGKDQNPKAGTPPPLCYLYGLGDFQFNAHPLLINSFNYSLPNNVDYIRAGSPTLVPGQSPAGYSNPNNSQTVSGVRMNSNGLSAGANTPPPVFSQPTNKEPTYVPTKMQITISAIPIVTRNDISNRFSLRDYATGGLLLGKTSKGGIW